MKLWKLVLSLMCFAPSAQAQEIIFPDVGSYRITQTVYLTTEQEGSLQRMEVAAVVAGRPIFRGHVGSKSGLIFETASAVVVAEDGCGIEPQDFLPPAVPNVCGWTPCQMTPGAEVRKEIHLYSTMHRCQIQRGAITAKAIGTKRENIPGLGVVEVIVTDMKANLGSWFTQIVWRASILPGFGEVLGESAGRETRVLDARFVPRYGTPLALGEVPIAHLSHSAGISPKSESRSIRGDIVAFGDSLSAGLGAIPEDTYPARLELLLRTAGFDLRVGNAGVIGELSTSARDRVAEVISVGPKFVLLAFGANDVLQGVSPEEIQKNICFMIRSLKASGIQVLLIGIEADEVKTAYVERLRRMFRTIADEEDVPLVPSMLNGVLGNRVRMSTDGVHPNALGYQVVAETILPHLKALIQKQ